MSIEGTIRAHVEKVEAETAKRDAQLERDRLKLRAEREAAIEAQRQLILGVLAAVITLALDKLEQVGYIYTGAATGNRFTRRIRPLGFLPWITVRDKQEWALWQLAYASWEYKACLALRRDGTIWQIRRSIESKGDLIVLRRFELLYSSLHTPGLHDLKIIYREMRNWAIHPYNSLISEDEIRPLEFPIRDEKLRKELGMKPGAIQKQPAHQ